jgi:uncharacterized GH25 family protein
MRLATRSALALALLGLSAPLARAHFNMLLPQAASIKKGEAVTVDYQWGHPFEHQLFDAPKPDLVFAVAPDGSHIDLTDSVEKVSVPAGDKKATAYRFRFTPQQRGDYVLVLLTPAIWMEEEQEFWQDAVKVVLHVQAQRGWDAPALLHGENVYGFRGHTWASDVFLEFVPLTRPYGLRPGMVFQARALKLPPPVVIGAPPTPPPAADTLVEIERYNPAPPKQLPPDEDITRTAKTDPNGVVTGTLAEPGWWCLTAGRGGGKRERGGKDYPVRQRTTLWVFVDEKAKP